MQSELNSHPVVLAIGGHDPSGGAGIQADIEALAANGVHTLSLITCLTLQDSCNVQAVQPVGPALLARQAELLLADSAVDAIKIGLLGNREIATRVADLLQAHPGIPVVLDPVLAAGGGSDLAGAALLQSLRERLLPHCDLITPNIPEALRLSGLDADAPAPVCAERLLDLGANAVLITGTHEAVPAAEITHRLYRPGTPTLSLASPRLPGEYHGSGCTLAAAITARLAQGESLEQAVEKALDFTWQTLRHAFHSGRCQATPNRLYRLFSTEQDKDG
jgi:hydroxymethylpyrimidine/phosphomethylpyrimidine kinase